MTSEYSPLLRTGSPRTAGAQHHQAIHAHYYDITNTESWPIAGLLVLVDSRGTPVRAELHTYDGLHEQEQEAAIRQARLVLLDHYTGGDPVPLRILETMQIREAMEVRLPPVGTHGPRTPARSGLLLPWRIYGLVGGGALLMGFLIWLVVGWLGSGAGQQVGELSSEAATPVAAAMNAPPPTGGGTPGADAAAPAAGAPMELPPSRNARPDLAIGARVTVVPGLQVALRTEPGLESGTDIGLLVSTQQATIIGGPELRRGDADTIVWWYLRLDAGTEAWAAANTSTLTVLIPAE